MDVDQVLLSGLVACQSGAVPIEQLHQAIQTWAEEPTQSFTQIMQDLGVLTENRRAAIEQMVDAYLRLHDGNAARALQSCDASDEWTSKLRTELSKANVASGQDGHSTAYDTYATLSPTEPEHSHQQVQASPGDRFEILRPHARGGLGEVYVAQDHELNRVVALKEIQSEFVEVESSRARFLREAEITGSLEHPGIVPVYGLGSYQDGRLYYAMRFIEGQSLHAAIEALHRDRDVRLSDKSLRLRSLLGQLVDVCNAIEYAHSRGVLHRDIKPDNIMLGSHGETLVVDWGLAKSLAPNEASALVEESWQIPASGSVATVMGSAVGTPAYMPPEQAAGRLQDLSPASDIYSLGATLYHILAGRPPFVHEDLPTLFTRIQDGDFPSLAHIRGDIPKPLQRICEHAMSSRPEQRYASAQALAGDIECFLADEPVSVMRESAMSRATRWIRKHRTASTAIAGSALVTLVGLAVFATVISGKNHQLSQLNSSLDRKNVELDLKNQEAQSARTLAEEKEAIAKRQSQLALTTLSSVVLELQDSLRDLPRAGSIRRDILKNSLEQLEQLATQYVEHTVADRATMQALSAMGDVVAEFGMNEGHLDPLASMPGEHPRLASDPSDDPEGSMQAVDPAPAESMSAGPSAERSSAVVLASQFYMRALEIGREIVRSQPQDRESRKELSVVLSQLANLKRESGEYAQSLDFYREAMELREQLLAEDPDDLRARFLLSASHFDFAHRALDEGNVALALERFEKCCAIRQDLASVKEGEVMPQRQLAIALTAYAEALVKDRRLEAAMQTHEQALEIRERLVAVEPRNASLSRELCVSYDRLAGMYDRVDEAAKAKEMATRMHSCAGRMLDRDPSNSDSQLFVGISKYRLAIFLGNDSPRSESLCRDSTRMLESLVASDPYNTAYQEQLGYSLNRLAEIMQAKGAGLEAIEPLQRRAAIYEKLIKDDPSNQVFVAAYVRSLNNLAEQHAENQATAQAMVCYQQSLKFCRKRANQKRDDLNAQEAALDACRRLAQFYLEQGRPNEVSSVLESALEIIDRVEAMQIDNFQSLRNALVELDRLGVVASEVEQRATAITIFTAMQRFAQQLISFDPGDSINQDNLQVAHRRLGEQYLAAGETEQARAEYAAQLKLARDYHERAPNDPPRCGKLAYALEKYADFNWKCGDYETAFALLEESIQWRSQRVEFEPDRAVFHAVLAKTLETMADYRHARDQGSVARAHTLKAIEHRRIALRIEPDNTSHMRTLANGLNDYGVLLDKLDEDQDASRLFEESIQLKRTLVSANPDSASRLRSLLISVSNLASLHDEMKNLKDAIRWNREYVELAVQLIEMDPSERNARSVYYAHRDLAKLLQKADELIASVEHARLATKAARVIEQDSPGPESRARLADALNLWSKCLNATAQYQHASDRLQEAIELQQQELQTRPDDEGLLQDLSESNSLLGVASEGQGKLERAEEAYRTGFKLAQQAVQDNSTDRLAVLTLVARTTEFSRFLHVQGRPAEAVQVVDQSLDALRTLLSSEQDSRPLHALHTRLQKLQATYEFYSLVLGDWDTLLQQPAAELPALLLQRGIALIELGKLEEAAQAAATIPKQFASSEIQYNAACVLALAINSSGTQAEPVNNAKELAAAAVARLELALEYGFDDWPLLQSDPDLDAIRQVDAFQEMLSRVQKVGEKGN